MRQYSFISFDPRHWWVGDANALALLFSFVDGERDAVLLVVSFDVRKVFQPELGRLASIVSAYDCIREPS